MPNLVRTTLYSFSLLLGVSFISFMLMVYLGPDRSYAIAGKNPDQAQLQEIRTQLGYDQPLLQRYGKYLKQLATLDLGRSESSGKPVSTLLAETIPVSLSLLLPGFLLGNLLALVLAMVTAWYRHRWPDRILTSLSMIGVSISFIIVVFVFSLWLSTPQGINLFPSRGWRVDGISSWFTYATVPSLALIFATLFFNLRFYRALLIDEMEQDYVRTARAYGAGPVAILFTETLPNILVPVVTRLLFSLPAILISGSLVLESFFGIPGVGKLSYDAIVNADQPVLNAIVALSAIMVIFITWLVDLIYPVIDPRISNSPAYPMTILASTATARGRK